MATDTLTGPTLLGSSTRAKVYRNFIDGEWVESTLRDLRYATRTMRKSAADNGCSV